MSAMLKLFVLTICLNTFIYLGVNYAVYGTSTGNEQMQDDLFGLLLYNATESRQELTDYFNNLNSTGNISSNVKVRMNANFSVAPDPQTGASISQISGGFSYYDTIKIVYAFVKTLWKIAFMPIYLFSYGVMPLPVLYIIAIPLGLLQLITLIVLIRGGGAI
jgi:hypothetical protein